MVNFFHRCQQPVGILGIATVWLNDNLDLGAVGILAKWNQSFGSIIQINIPVSARTAIHTNGITTQLRGTIHPALVLINGAGPLFDIRGV